MTKNQADFIAKLLVVIVAFLVVLPLRFLPNSVPMELFYIFWLVMTFFFGCLQVISND